MNYLKHIIFIISFSTAYFTSFAQTSFFVGQMGSNQKKYENSLVNSKINLLDVCDSNLDSAYQIWVNVMFDLEQYAESVNFDLKGLKLWMHIFVTEDKITELYFHPKPNSRNTDFTKVSSLFEKFISVYNFPIKSSQHFNHYGSGSFPVFYIRHTDNEK